MKYSTKSDNLNDRELPNEFISTVSSEQYLATRVPFSSADERIIQWTTWENSPEESFPRRMRFLLGIGGGAGGGFAINQIFETVSKLVGEKDISDDTKDQLKEKSESIIEQAQKHADEVERATGASLDQLDEELGKINVDNAGNLE